MTWLRRVAAPLAGALTVLAIVAPGSASAQLTPQTGALVLEHLANFASHQPGIGDFLLKLGVGDATGVALSNIQATLAQVNAKLDALQNSVNELRASTEKARCESIQNTLRERGSAVKGVWHELTANVKNAGSESKSTQMESAKTLKQKIDAMNTPGPAAIDIHDALVGTPGSPSMIDRCGFAFQTEAGDFLSSHLHEQVVKMVDYWEGLEAQAAVLTIGLDQANQKQAAAHDRYNRTVRDLHGEAGKIKPSLTFMVLDVRQQRLWVRDFRSDVSYQNAGNFAPAGFLLPTISELRLLLKAPCCRDVFTGAWFDRFTPFRIPPKPGTNREVLTREVLHTGQGRSVQGDPTAIHGVVTMNLDSGAEFNTSKLRSLTAKLFATWTRPASGEQTYLYPS